MSYFGRVTAISATHEEVHQGRSFNVSETWTAITTKDVLLDNSGNAQNLHANFGLEADQDVQFELLEAAVVSASGTPIPVINLDRTSANTSGLVTGDGPTVTTPGTTLRKVYTPAGGVFGGGGAAVSDGPTRGGTEWVLQAGVIYLVRMTLGASGDLGFEVTFYEAP